MKIESRVPSGDAAPELNAIARHSKAHWGYTAEQMELWRPALAVWPEYLQAQIVRTVFRDGVCVGFYAIVSQEKLLDHFWLLPGAMGEGIGRRMFAHAVDSAKAAGRDRLRIVSDPHAEGFYRRMGARRIGVEESSLPRFLPVMQVDLPIEPSA